MRTALLRQLERHEGYRQRPYKDTVGKLTIGIGRNLDDVGISLDEARYLCERDVAEAENLCRQNFPWFDALDSVRQDVLINMMFNMGPARLKKFTRTLAFIQARKFSDAGAEMLDSRWAQQVGDRAAELSQQMATGVYSDGPSLRRPPK